MKIGINIHPVMPNGEEDTRAYSAQEKIDLDQFLLASQPSAILVMNDFGWATRFADMLPQAGVIFRLYNKDVEGELWNALSPAEYFEGMKIYHNPRIILNVGNEPDGKLPLDELNQMVAWYVEVMRLFAQAGIRVAVPAWGSGNPNLTWFTDDTAWSLLRPLFAAFQTYTMHYLNLHTYFNRKGLQIGNGHLDRPAQMAERLQARGLPIPNMVITEYGADTVDEIPGPWMTAFGETDEGEDQYGELLVQGVRLALNQPYVKGVLAYCWGAYPKWMKYNLARATRVQKRLVAANAEAVPAPVPDEEIPEPMPDTPEPPVAQPPVIINPPDEQPTEPADPIETPPTAVESAWMKDLPKWARARIAMGRLMQEFGDELRGFIVDDEAYETIGILTAMLDAKS